MKYKNYIFDLYGTLIDINTNEWSAQLWKKMAILYGYYGAQDDDTFFAFHGNMILNCFVSLMQN